MQEEYDLARARLETMPENIGIATLRFGAMTKEDALKHIDAKDNVGEFLVDVQIRYLRSLKERK